MTFLKAVNFANLIADYASRVYQGDGLQKNPFAAKFAAQYLYVPAHAHQGNVAVPVVSPYNGGGAAATAQVYPTGDPGPSAPTIPHGAEAMPYVTKAMDV